MVLSIFCFHSLSQNSKQSVRLIYFLKMCTQITLYAIITESTSKYKQNIDSILTNVNNPPTWL